MLEAFELTGGQIYRRAGTVFHITKAGHKARLVVWQTNCQVCGSVATYSTKPNQSPIRNYVRRCRACIDSGARKRAPTTDTPDAPLAMPRKQAMVWNNALMEPFGAPEQKYPADQRTNDNGHPLATDG